jgi:hypothetical protein
MLLFLIIQKRDELKSKQLTENDGYSFDPSNNSVHYQLIFKKL